jgi:glycosyltransferase 2 family protein
MKDTPSPPASRGQKKVNVLVSAVGVVVSAVFLYLAFRDLQPEAFLASLGSVLPGWIVGAALLYSAKVVMIAMRWGYLLRGLVRVPLASLSGIVSIGYMGNNVYPLRAGEALRVFLLWRDYRVPPAASATTVLLERVFDGIVMISFILIGLVATDTPSPEVQAILRLAAPVFAVATLVFLAMAARPDLLRRLAKWGLGWLPVRVADVLTRLVDDVIDGLAGLRNPLDLVRAIITSYGNWAVEALVYWMVMWAFQLDLPYAIALLMVGAVNLVGLIPASPGQVGVYEFVVSSVLIAAGVDRDTSLAFAITVHLVIWLPVTVVGFALLVRRGMGWADISRARALEAQAAVGTPGGGIL